MTPEYSVEPRTLRKTEPIWVVMRRGPKGGRKFVAGYKQEHQANDVAATLNRWAGQEV